MTDQGKSCMRASAGVGCWSIEHETEDSTKTDRHHDHPDDDLDHQVHNELKKLSVQYEDSENDKNDEEFGEILISKINY